MGSGVISHGEGRLGVPRDSAQAAGGNPDLSQGIRMTAENSIPHAVRTRCCAGILPSEQNSSFVKLACVDVHLNEMGSICQSRHTPFD